MPLVHSFLCPWPDLPPKRSLGVLSTGCSQGRAALKTDRGDRMASLILKAERRRRCNYWLTTWPPLVRVNWLVTSRP